MTLPQARNWVLTDPVWDKARSAIFHRQTANLIEGELFHTFYPFTILCELCLRHLMVFVRVKVSQDVISAPPEVLTGKTGYSNVSAPLSGSIFTHVVATT